MRLRKNNSKKIPSTPLQVRLHPVNSKSTKQNIIAAK